MKIAVVGAGICGLSAARALTQRGHQVQLHEQFELFHDRGSSHGASRIVRRAYSDPFYTACMAEAYPMWADLEAASGRKLIDECGLLYFGGRDAPNIRSVIVGLTDLNVPFEVRDSETVKELVPQLRLDTDEVAVWTPEAGWVNAAKALRTLYELATKDGLSTVIGSAADPLELAKENDAVVVAAGSWTTRYLKIPVKVTLQTYGYIQAKIPGPVWIEDGEDLPYGFPSDALGQKIGIHRPGPEIDPDIAERSPSSEFMDAIRRVAANRFGVKNPELLHVKTCIYTTTPTEDFLLGRVAPKVYFGSACSGHGFKLGPWVGRLLADFVEAKDFPERHPRFYWPSGS